MMSDNKLCSQISSTFTESVQLRLRHSDKQASKTSNFTDKDAYHKSHISLAETTCDQNSPLFHRFQDFAFDNQSNSLHEFDLDEQNSSSLGEERCLEFFQNGFCMFGVECNKLHGATFQETQQTKKQKKPFIKIFTQLPELILQSQKRTHSILG